MERRLLETENMLCALMSQASNDQIESAFLELKHIRQNCDGHAETFESTRGNKFGPAYWEKFPLNSVQSAKSWWTDRSLAVIDGASSSMPEPTDCMLDDQESPHSGNEYGEEVVFETSETLASKSQASMATNMSTNLVESHIPDFEQGRSDQEIDEALEGSDVTSMRSTRRAILTPHNKEESQRIPTNPSPAQGLEDFEEAFIW
nr:uncharacterized protein CTRU02_13817 [Colletotrichum truncatum]KAF6782991.1 hypothetical protein CTRU02_13817 [Colletotrichum truncatum]